MKTELRYSWPSAEGVNPEYIVNFLNACEKADSEIHGIMIARHGNVIFEAYNAPYAAEIPHIMHSFTKTLTNTAVALAYDDGLLDLDNPILKYFPEYEPEANEYLKKMYDPQYDHHAERTGALRRRQRMETFKDKLERCVF